ncbi:MAG: fibronectin type III domain-containing protein [Bacteroidota bacterium]
MKNQIVLLLVITLFIIFSVNAQTTRLKREIQEFFTTYGDRPVLDLSSAQLVKLKEIINDTITLEDLTKRDIQSIRKDLQYLKEIISYLGVEFQELSNWRNIVNETGFVRGQYPNEFNQLENQYDSLRVISGRLDFESLKKRIEKLGEGYKNLTDNSSKRLKRKAMDRLNFYAQQLQEDKRIIETDNADSTVLYRKANIIRRLGNNFLGGISGSGFDLVDEPPYYPPPVSPSNGPKAPIVVDIVDRKVDTLKLSWIDLSTNETGNRLLRFAETGFEEIENFGALEKFSTNDHFDTNLTPNTRYCYKIETFNDQGFNSSQTRCAYTRDTITVPVWRVQLKVVVADLKNAGTDNLMMATLKTADGVVPIPTYMDYGRDDFERNKTYEYDLNFDGIKEMADIIGFSLHSYESGDKLLVKEIALVVNHHEVFRRFFGDTSSTAFEISEFSGYNVEYEELTGYVMWQNYRDAVGLLPSFAIFPLIDEIDGQNALIIKNEQLVSRIEGLVGHMIHSDPEIEGKMKWGKLNGPAVEIKKKSINSVSVDLDMQAKVNNNFDPSLDIDFDISFSKSCIESGDETVLRLGFASSNFVSDTDSSWWQDVLSLGTSYLISKLIDWYSDNCTTPPSISRSVEVNLGDEIDCEDLELSVNDNGDLIICCAPN